MCVFVGVGAVVQAGGGAHGQHGARRGRHQAFSPQAVMSPLGAIDAHEQGTQPHKPHGGRMKSKILASTATALIMASQAHQLHLCSS